ncbi:AMP-binding protein [Flexivirga caeni]|uniref:AMP-dependent synthetase n=1 Tax=Flexivirga caeni TaxID=2294115 RepID=A0A3M9M547_9MICO|nr:AMP-binding protein [Flexivirga caeni]RNI20679.1 AMP-dependent synthetase [Flexivirga caeni]
MGQAATTAYRAARDFLLNHRDDYDAAVNGFHWPDLGDEFCWAVDWFDVVAQDNDRPALVIVEQDGSRAARTFQEMSRRSDQVATWLGSLGVRKGDAVLVMLNNQVELWETMLGVMKLGAVIVPTATAAGPADLTDRIGRTAARAVVANAADTEKLDGLPGDYLRIAVGETAGWRDFGAAFETPWRPIAHPGTAPQDRLLLYFTSGTTSKPKLVEHTQVSYPVGHLSTFYWIGLRPGDVHLNVSSPGWAKHAWSNFFAPWIGEATIFLYSYTRFDAPAMLEQLRSEGVTSFCAPPTVWRMLINADLGDKPATLREVVGAGEPLNPEVIRQIEKSWGVTIRDGYGQTETSVQIANTPGSRVKPGSMGRPLPGVPSGLADPTTGELLPAGANEGEICLDLGQHPVGLMTGYVADPERNADVMAHGVYHTGDVASRDADGYYTYIGRTDDVFKASDYKISPFELESVLIEHPAVAEAAVVPAPDPVRLAIPKAYIALAPGHDATRETAFEILKYAREHLAPYQRVRRVEFYELPKTISGKIRRVELRGREADIAGSRSVPEWRDDDFPELKG